MQPVANYGGIMYFRLGKYQFINLTMNLDLELRIGALRCGLRNPVVPYSILTEFSQTGTGLLRLKQTPVIEA